MKRKILFFATLLLLSLPAFAQQSEQQARESIVAAARQLKTMQCDFVQTKRLKMLGSASITSEGRMYYSQGEKLRWEYVKPYQYTFILSGGRVLLKNKERSDVIDVAGNRLFREIARIMMSSVVGSSLTDERTFKTAIAAEGGEWVATLTPMRRDMKQMFQRIVLHFDRRQAAVCRVELHEKNGDTTIIDLKNIRKNETIAPSTFAVE